jgi:hypothetical protein
MKLYIISSAWSIIAVVELKSKAAPVRPLEAEFGIELTQP